MGRIKGKERPLKVYDEPGKMRKQCPGCQKWMHLSVKECPCGHAFVKPKEPAAETTTKKVDGGTFITRPEGQFLALDKSWTEPGATAFVPEPPLMSFEQFSAQTIIALIQAQGFTVVGWRNLGDLCEAVGSAWVGYLAVNGEDASKLHDHKKRFQDQQAYFSGPWLEEDPHRFKGGGYGDVPITEILKNRTPEPGVDRAAGFPGNPVTADGAWAGEEEEEVGEEFLAWQEAQNTGTAE